MKIVDRIRAKAKAVPFEPFAIRMRHGEDVLVKGSEYVFVSPFNNLVAVAVPRAWRMLDPNYIDELVPASSETPAKAS